MTVLIGIDRRLWLCPQLPASGDPVRKQLATCSPGSGFSSVAGICQCLDRELPNPQNRENYKGASKPSVGERNLKIIYFSLVKI